MQDDKPENILRKQINKKEYLSEWKKDKNKTDKTGNCEAWPAYRNWEKQRKKEQWKMCDGVFTKAAEQPRQELRRDIGDTNTPTKKGTVPLGKKKKILCSVLFPDLVF